MIQLKLLLIFILGLFLADVSFAGFVPKAFEGDFVQIKQNRRGGERKAPVVIKYSYPKNFRMEVSEYGTKTLYICNAEKTWVFNPGLNGEPGNVRVGKSSKYCYSQIFSALNQGLKDNKFYSVKKLKDDEYLLSFTSSAASQLGFDQVKIIFKSGSQSFQNITKLELINKGKRAPVVLEKKSLSVKSNINASEFNFSIPKGVEVQNMK